LIDITERDEVWCSPLPYRHGICCVPSNRVLWFATEFACIIWNTNPFVYHQTSIYDTQRNLRLIHDPQIRLCIIKRSFVTRNWVCVP
jgi:hypothetical protein